MLLYKVITTIPCSTQLFQTTVIDYFFSTQQGDPFVHSTLDEQSTAVIHPMQYFCDSRITSLLWLESTNHHVLSFRSSVLEFFECINACRLQTGRQHTTGIRSHPGPRNTHGIQANSIQ